MSPALDHGRQRRARWHERRLCLVSHPWLFLGLALAARRGPVCTIPGIGHVVSDPVLARQVLSSEGQFTKTGPGALSDALTGIMGRRALVNMDGEPHRELRAQLRSLFTPRFVAELVPRIFEQPLAQARARIEGGHEVDLVRLAQVLAGRAACTIVGVDATAGPDDDACLDLYRKGLEFASVISLGTRQLGRAETLATQARLHALTEGARAAYQRSDECSVPGRLRAAGLEFEDSRGVIGLLLLAGTETTASALPRIVALLIDTGQWATLRADRALLSRAIDEGLRATGPLAVVTRNVAEPTTLGGRRLRKGARVIVCIANLLKSPRAVADRSYFDIAREQPPQLMNLWFGHGPHFCLGAALAHAEIESALTALLDCGELEIARRRYGRRALFPAYANLDVRRRAA
ncbi:MAG: cytochrome P450 [Steroidobacteraceae bacterium]